MFCVELDELPLDPMLVPVPTRVIPKPLVDDRSMKVRSETSVFCLDRGPSGRFPLEELRELSPVDVRRTAGLAYGSGLRGELAPSLNRREISKVM